MLENLDIAIGFVTVMLGFSLIIMVLTQAVNSFINLRGKQLMSGLASLIANTTRIDKTKAKEIAQAALNHELVATKLFGFLKTKPAGAIQPKELENILELLRTKKADGKYIHAALGKDLEDNFSDLEKGITKWFDASMDRVTDRFVATTGLVTAILAVILAFATHLDSLSLMTELSSDVQLRAGLVAASGAVSDRAQTIMERAEGEDTPASFEAAANQLNQRLESIQSDFNAAGLDLLSLDHKLLGFLPGFGVPESQDTGGDAGQSGEGGAVAPAPNQHLDGSWRHFWGIVISAALLSLGAPFWFNALQKLSSLRPLLAHKGDEERERRENPQRSDHGGGTGGG